MEIQLRRLAERSREHEVVVGAYGDLVGVGVDGEDVERVGDW